MVAQKLAPEEQLYAFQKNEIETLWKICQPFLERIREEENRPQYCHHFQYLHDTWLPLMSKKEKH